MSDSRWEARLGRSLLVLALAWAAFQLAPEARISRFPVNDLVFHRAAAERMGESLTRGEPFLDPWVDEWALGYPLWRAYQPLPHLLAALVLRAVTPLVDPATAFAALHYALMALLPLSVYAGARLFGLAAPAAGLASVLVLLPAASGELDRYGLGLGAVAWRGSGLFAQLVGLHLLALTLGLVARALDTGRGRALAAFSLAATALAHVAFGYVAFVSTAILALAGPAAGRPLRLARALALVLLALPLVAWFFVPAALDNAEINRSRFEPEFKWTSFGAKELVPALASGRLLDAGRFPTLTLLAALGALAALAARRESALRPLLALALAWLLLFFGHATWGHLMLLAGLPSGALPVHRFQAAFELCAVLLAAAGLERVLRLAARSGRAAAAAVALLATLAVGTALAERQRFLAQGAAWGDSNAAAHAREASDLEAAFADVRQLLARTPGRVSAGRAAGWGGSFKVGDAPVYALLTRERFDQASFLYHALSKSSDAMVLRDDRDPAQDTLFGIRAVVAPADLEAPPHLTLRGRHGRFTVYESSSEGYFGLVDVVARYAGPRSRESDVARDWLASGRFRAGQVAALEPHAGVPVFGPFELPPATAAAAACGSVLGESREPGAFRARVRLERACHVLLKVTWHPRLRAEVDGRPARVVRVTPGFAAIAAPAGAQDVLVRYAPGPLRPLLLLLGLACFAAVARSRTLRLADLERGVAEPFRRAARRLATPRAHATLAIALLAALALRPLLRGELVAGHDATEYPPRLVEMARVLGDWHLPPVWAPDLGAGHGQPLFQFAPPLLYVLAAALCALGASLTDALQLALAALLVVGAASVYRIGRHLEAPRAAATCAAAAWLFAPYLALDVAVRGAMAESTALAVAPLALLLLLRAGDLPRAPRLAQAAAAVALLPLTHVGAALLLLPAIALVALASASASARPARASATVAAALALGLGLAAYFWVPAAFEQDYVKTHLLREGFLHFSQHALEPLQLVAGAWGFGLSGPGPNDGMSFSLGLGHLLAGLAGLALAFASRHARERRVALALAAVAACGAWLATTWSSALWGRLEPLQSLAYPWRALMLPALALPLLTLPLVARLPGRACVALTAALVALNLSHTEPSGYLRFDDEYYAPERIARAGLATTTREEYEPRGVRERPRYSPDRLTGLDAPLEVVRQRLTAARQEFRVSAAAATRVEAATFDYPVWTALVDGRPVPVTSAPASGRIRFRLEPGEHDVVLELRPTPLRRAALGVSGLSLALLLLAAVGRRGIVPDR